MTRTQTARRRPPAEVPAWPAYELHANADGTVTVTGPAAEPGPYPDRTAAVAAVAQLAAALHPPRPVRAEAHDQGGTVWPLHIAADGTTTEAGAPHTVKKRARKGKSAATPAAAPAERAPAATTPPARAAAVAVPAPAAPDRQPPTARLIEDAPTTQVRHPRPVPDARPQTIAPPAPARREHPTGPDPRTPTPAPAVPSVLTIQRYESEGRYGDALAMAQQLDRIAAAHHGMSHPRALQARELLAHITMRSGDLTGAIRLYRDAAERWAMRGDTPAAEAAAGRAHALWQTMTDPTTAIPAGETIVRMRQTVPGAHQDALTAAVRRLDRLKKRAAQPH